MWFVDVLKEWFSLNTMVFIILGMIVKQKAEESKKLKYTMGVPNEDKNKQELIKKELAY